LLFYEEQPVSQIGSCYTNSIISKADIKSILYIAQNRTEHLYFAEACIAYHNYTATNAWIIKYYKVYIYHLTIIVRKRL